MSVTSKPGHKTFLYEEIAEDIASLIREGTYRTGERLPSVRQLSRQRKVSVTSILQAYLLLEEQGLIEARPQSGYYVRARLPAALPEPEISAPAPDPMQLSVRELVMMVLRDSNNPELIQLGTAIPNADLVSNEKLNRIMASLARQDKGQLSLYEMPPGNETLRVQIAQRAVAAGCNLSPADIVITSGCQDAINLSLRAVTKAGDTVAIESPVYFGVLQVLESLDLRVLEIPTHPRDGISLGALQFAIEHTPVHACLVLPNFNNPLGSCIPDERKGELVELLAGHNIPLIEVDDLGEIYFSGPRPSIAKAYDRKGLVLTCSSFSYDLCPGYRVGWVIPGKFRPVVEWLKFTTSIAAPTLAQEALAQFLASGGYEHHLRRIRREYAHCVAQMSQAVMRHFPEGTRLSRPNGGYMLWVQLPEYADSLKLYKQALEHGITLAPGYIFSATQQYRNFIRLNAAWWSFSTSQAVKTLGELVAGQAG